MFRPLLIDRVSIDPPFALAPLAGYTDSAMRRLCRAYGAGVVWTEMVSAEAIVRGAKKTLALLAFHPSERPIAFQLFGTRPEVMAQAAACVAELRPDLLDINFGCPARKVVRSGGGAALMGDPGRLHAIARAVVGATAIPVTAKMRSGVDGSRRNAVEIAEGLAAEGIAAVVVHPRTAAQGFKGRSDWSVIRAVKERVPVPVIGSGDVREPADALAMFEETGCDGVMIGRGAVGSPWLFSRLRSLASGGTLPPPPTFAEVLRTCIEHLDLSVASKGEERGVLEMRKHLVLYLRGFPHASALRSELVRIGSHEAVRSRLLEALSAVTESGVGRAGGVPAVGQA